MNRFDLRFVIKWTLAIICKIIDLPKISLILCINSYSLYHYFIQLGTTNEKWLIIDIIALK